MSRRPPLSVTQQKRRHQEVWPQPIMKRLRDQLQWTESLPLLACKTSLLNHYPLIMLEAQHRCGSFPISGGKSEAVVMQAWPKTSPAAPLLSPLKKRNKKCNLSLKEQPISWKRKQVVRTNTRAAQTHTSCIDFVPWPVQPGPKSPPPIPPEVPSEPVSSSARRRADPLHRGADVRALLLGNLSSIADVFLEIKF